MVRKQLYITEAQERALKRRAREEGRSEAEVARRALATHLRPAGKRRPSAPTEASRKQALDELLEGTRKLARGRRIADDFRRQYREEGRAVLYEKRLRHAGKERGSEEPGAEDAKTREETP